MKNLFILLFGIAVVLTALFFKVTMNLQGAKKVDVGDGPMSPYFGCKYMKSPDAGCAAGVRVEHSSTIKVPQVLGAAVPPQDSRVENYLCCNSYENAEKANAAMNREFVALQLSTLNTFFNIRASQNVKLTMGTAWRPRTG